MTRFNATARRSIEQGVVRSWNRANRLNELAGVNARPSVARSFLRRFKKEAVLLDSPEADCTALVAAYRRSLKAPAPTCNTRPVPGSAVVVSTGSDNEIPLLQELADMARRHGGISTLHAGLDALQLMQITE